MRVIVRILLIVRHVAVTIRIQVQVVIAVIAAIAVPVVAHTIPTVQVLMVVEVDHLYIGARTLSTGIHGSDVDQLVPYLVRNYYLKDGVVSKKGGYYVYDSNVVNAVKHFQKDAGLTQDGKLTSDVLTKLKSWSSSQTTIPLGFRDLSAAAETSGFDVDELIKLLINAGYSPDPAKLKKSGTHYVFTDDVHTALKAFQAYHSIQPDGELNAVTLAKLKSYDK